MGIAVIIRWATMQMGPKGIKLTIDMEQTLLVVRVRLSGTILDSVAI